MKKTKPYTPIYADILDKSSPEPPSSKVKGVSYLPSEIEANAKEFERRRQIRAERTVVVLLSIAVILMGMALSLFGILEVLVAYVAAILIACLVIRLRRARPLCKESFPEICVVITGWLPYLILTAGDKQTDKL